MKRLMLLGSIGLFFGLNGAETVKVTHDLKYGIAHRDADGVLKILNICSVSGVQNCQVGKFMRAGVEIPESKAIVRLVVNGVTIMPGETKEVPSTYFQRFGRGGAEWTGIKGTAYYDDIAINFEQVIMRPSLTWPIDFKNTSH